VSLMIAWRVPYWALWDNDEAGRNAKEQATLIKPLQVCFMTLKDRR